MAENKDRRVLPFTTNQRPLPFLFPLNLRTHFWTLFWTQNEPITRRTSCKWSNRQFKKTNKISSYLLPELTASTPWYCTNFAMFFGAERKVLPPAWPSCAFVSPKATLSFCLKQKTPNWRLSMQKLLFCSLHLCGFLLFCGLLVFLTEDVRASLGLGSGRKSNPSPFMGSFVKSQSTHLWTTSVVFFFSKNKHLITYF